MSNTKTDFREILNQLFARTDGNQKKLINNWCKSEKGCALQMWVRSTDMESVEFKRFLVEIDKALESDNWTFFDPSENNPSEGQAVRVEPQAADADADTETEEETEEDTDADDEDYSDESDSNDEPEAVLPKQDGRGVPAPRFAPPVDFGEDTTDDEDEDEDEVDDAPVVTLDERAVHIPAPAQPAPTPLTNGVDPLAALVDAITEKVAAKLKASIPAAPAAMDHNQLYAAIDKRLNNGGFPIGRVMDILDERRALDLSCFLRSQDPQVVERAIRLYNKG